MFVRTAKATHIFIGLSGVKIGRLWCNLVVNLFSVSANLEKNLVLFLFLPIFVPNSVGCFI